MDWEKLRSNKCPHCGEAIELYDGQIKCTDCFFTMPVGRFNRMITEPGDLNKRKIMKWQYLKDGRCPMPDCHHLLREVDSKTRLVRCGEATCTFKIDEGRLSKILGDREHAANKFRSPREEAQGFERHLL